METPMDKNIEEERARLEKALAENEASDKKAQEELARAMEALATLEAGEKAPDAPPAQKGELVSEEEKEWADKLESAAKTSEGTEKPRVPTDKTEKKSWTKMFSRKEKKTEPAPANPEEQIKNFITEFKLETYLGPEFNDLTEAQKLKVVQDLKRRIVDIVKSDAKTQYSESLKNKSVFKSVWSSLVTKESDIKNREKEIFKKIKDTDEGQMMIAKDLALLTDRVKDREVYIGAADGAPHEIFLSEDSTEVHKNFNDKAKKFASLPYEWGQEKGGKHRQEYDKAKVEYEKARNEILEREKSKEAPGEEGTAIIKVLKADSAVQMDQLLNTHPEFEQALADMERSAGAKEMKKSATAFLQNIVGKNATNKLLFVGGYATRAATISILGAVAAPVVGAAIGGLRGRFRAKETLEERQRQARHGERDESKERVVITDAVHLARRLNEIREKLMNAKDEEEIKKLTSELVIRAEHTQGKIEKGQVNFGNAKEALVNQYDLVDALNKALVAKEFPEHANAEIKKRMEGLLAAQGRNIAEKTSAAQKEFIIKQMKRGAMIGAGAATAGYALRYFGEHMGWWGNHGVRPEPQNAQPGGGGFIDRVEGWMGKLKFWEKESVVPHGRDVNLPSEAHDVHLPGGTQPDGKDPFSISMTDEKGHFRSPFEIRPGAEKTAAAAEAMKVSPDAIVHKGEGIEHALRRQIEHNEELAKSLGYKGPAGDAKALHEFSAGAAHRVAIDHGYVDSSTGEEIRVKAADQVAYQLKADGTVDEIKVGGGVVESHGHGTAFEGDQKEDYEYSGRARIAGSETIKEDSESFYHPKNAKNPYEGIFDHREPAKAAEHFEKIPEHPGVEAVRESVMKGYDEAGPEIPPVRGEANINFGPAHPPYPDYGGRQSGINTVWHSSGGRQGWWGGNSKAEIIANKYGTGLRYNNFSGQNMGGNFYPDLSREQNLVLFSHPEFAKNPFHLGGQDLLEVYKVSQNNLRHVFSPGMLERWNSFKLLKAKDVFGDKNFETDQNWKFMYRHLRKLFEESGLKPKGGGLFRRAETLEQYIARASQKILKTHGSLDSITFVER